MLLLANSVAILNRHTRLARLETDTSLLAALGAALDRCIVLIIHFNTSYQPPNRTPFLKSLLGETPRKNKKSPTASKASITSVDEA
jgi:hypothetical protein